MAGASSSDKMFVTTRIDSLFFEPRTTYSITRTTLPLWRLWSDFTWMVVKYEPSDRTLRTANVKSFLARQSSLAPVLSASLHSSNPKKLRSARQIMSLSNDGNIFLTNLCSESKYGPTSLLRNACVPHSTSETVDI